MEFCDISPNILSNQNVISFISIYQKCQDKFACNHNLTLTLPQTVSDIPRNRENDEII